MSMDYFSISTDTSYMNGKSTASRVPLNTPENVRDVPCEGCPNENTCAVKLVECVAARQWYSTGDFDDKDVGRLLRGFKKK